MTLIALEQQSNLGKYLSEVYKIPVLTEEEEVTYAKQKEEGDLNAAKILISSHLRLVVKIAFKYQNYGLPMMDLISEGNIGLMKAVRDFSLSKGCRLATYAMWWIRASIQDFILKSWSLVKIGTTAAQKKLFFNLNKIKNKIMSYGQKDLNDENIKYISDALSVSKEEVVDMDNRLYKKDVSLNQKSKNSNEDGKEIMELVPAKTQTPEVILAYDNENKRRKELFGEAIGTLNERERNILSDRKLKENQATLKELSAKYGVSGERIRQIEENAIKKIQNYIKQKELNFK